MQNPILYFLVLIFFSGHLSAEEQLPPYLSELFSVTEASKIDLQPMGGLDDAKFEFYAVTEKLVNDREKEWFNLLFSKSYPPDSLDLKAIKFVRTVVEGWVASEGRPNAINISKKFPSLLSIVKDNNSFYFIQKVEFSPHIVHATIWFYNKKHQALVKYVCEV